MKSPITAAEESLAKALNDLRVLAEEVGRGKGGREVSLAITKLEEAQLWLSKVPQE